MWHELLISKFRYVIEQLPSAADYFAAIASVLTLAVVLFLAYEVVARVESPALRRLAATLFVFSLLVPLNVLRMQWSYAAYVGSSRVLGRLVMLAYGVVAIIVLARASTWRRAAEVVKSALLIASPFVLVTFGQALWAAGHATRAHSPAAAVSPPPSARTRVVWMIFDELDQRVTFEKRPPSLALPAFDRLRAESLAADRAFPPVDYTIASIPSLITGELITNVRWYTADDLLVKPQNGDFTSFRRHSNVFSRFHDAGGRSAIAGWYHPYCRLFGDVVRSCAAHATEREAGAPLATRMAGQFETVVMRLPLAYRAVHVMFPSVRQRIDDDARRAHVDALNEISASALEAITDEGNDFIFIHMPLPHRPYINVSGRTYFGNLELADAALARFRSAIASSSRAQSTVVLVSADHSWRFSAAEYDGIRDKRVPFILHFPNSTGSRIGFAFNTYVSANLVLDILAGKVRTAAEATQWLERNKRFAESPIGNAPEWKVVE